MNNDIALFNLIKILPILCLTCLVVIFCMQVVCIINVKISFYGSYL